MLSKLCWLTGVALLMTNASALADGPREKAADKPTAVHKDLDRLVGNWDVTLEFTYGGRAMKGTARCQAKWVLGGRFVEQEYTSEFMGKPLTILQLIGYDDVKKKLVEIHLASNRNQVTVNEGEVSDGGKVWNNVGELMNVATKKPVKLHTVYTFNGPDSFTLEWFQPDPADAGKEVKVVSMTHTRTK